MATKRAASSSLTGPRGAKFARPAIGGKQIPDRKIDGMLSEAGGSSRRIQPTDTIAKAASFRHKHPTVQSPYSKGLVNDGNNCYRNAVLQALFHVPVFVRYLTFHKDCTKQTNECVVCRLQDLCYAYWFKDGQSRSQLEAEDCIDDEDEESHRSVDPGLCRRFHAAMEMDQNAADNFHELRDAIAAGGEQSDAAGFLGYLIQEQIQRKKLPDDAIPYKTVFDIEMKESWTCQECGYEHIKDHENSGLGLAVPCGQEGMVNGRALSWGIEQAFVDQREQRCYETQDCIADGKDVFGEEELPGAVRNFKYTIVRAPEILFIDVRCFTTGPDANLNWVESKIKDRFNYPEQLDLSQYAEPGITDAFKYRLDSVIAHRGDRIQSGHYIAAVRKWNSDDSFHIIDDDNWVGTSRDGKLREAQRPTSFGSEAQAQFLLYSKIH